MSKKEKKLAEIVKPLTVLEELTRAAKQDHSHLHSASIRSKRDLLTFESQQIDTRINALTAAINDSKERKAAIQATIVGLGQVLSSR